MWFIVTEEERKKQEEHATQQFTRIMEESAKRSEARKAWEACKCPYCGRNDPLPPWLY